MADDEKNMDLLSVDEAAEYLRFSKAYVYRLTRLNAIPHIDLGRRIIFRKIDLFNWLGSMVSYNGLKQEEEL